MAKGRTVGHDEGFIEGQSKVIIAIMKKTNRTAKDVMEMLDIDKKIQHEINKFISANVNKCGI